MRRLNNETRLRRWTRKFLQSVEPASMRSLRHNEHYLKHLTRDMLEDRWTSLGISDMRLRRHDGGVLMYVTLSRPGLFIGKGGRDIDELTNRVKVAVPEVNFQGYRIIESDPMRLRKPFNIDI